MEEVKQHLKEEVPEYLTMDQTNTASLFIEAKVKKTIQEKLAGMTGTSHKNAI